MEYISTLYLVYIIYFIGFTISFDRHNYEVYENNESAKFVLLHLSEPFECCSFSVQIEIVDVTAVGKLLYRESVT